MILDLGSFTRRWLMVDSVIPAETWGRHLKHGKSRGCKTRKKVEEDRETTDLFAMVK